MGGMQLQPQLSELGAMSPHVPWQVSTCPQTHAAKKYTKLKVDVDKVEMRDEKVVEDM